MSRVDSVNQMVDSVYVSLLFAFALLAAASALHAMWNGLVKRANTVDSLFVWVYSVLGVPVFAAVLIAGLLENAVDAANWWPALISTLLHTAYALVLQRAYAAAALGVVYAVARGLAPPLVLLGVFVAGGPAPGVTGWVAMTIVLVGVVLVSDVGAATGDARVCSRGLGWGLLVAACIAAYTLWDSYAIAALGVDIGAYVSTAGLAQAALLSAAMWSRRSEMTKMLAGTWRVALPITVLVPLSYGLVLLAMQYASPELVATMRNLNIVFGVLVGVVLLGERQSARAWFGVLVIVAGAMLATW